MDGKDTQSEQDECHCSSSPPETFDNILCNSEHGIRLLLICFLKCCLTLPSATAVVHAKNYTELSGAQLSILEEC